MRSLCYLGVVVTILLGGSVRTYAQNATLADDLLADWQQQKAMMMAIAEAMPEETYGFKPTEAQRTYAEQILHIAGANVFLMQHVGGATAAPEVDTSDFRVFGIPAMSKTEVLHALSDGYDYGISVIQEFSEEELLQAVAGPPWLGNVTRVRMAYFTLSHAMDIYGQMAVYLRLNRVIPPASRRGGV